MQTYWNTYDKTVKGYFYCTMNSDIVKTPFMLSALESDGFSLLDGNKTAFIKLSVLATRYDFLNPFRLAMQGCSKEFNQS